MFYHGLPYKDTVKTEINIQMIKVNIFWLCKMKKSFMGSWFGMEFLSRQIAT